MRPVSTESGYNREDLKEGVPLDAFEQVMTRKIRQQRYRRFALAILLVLLIPSVLIGCFLALNQFRIDMVMHGDSCITLEYGQKYTEPGAEATLYGQIYPAEGKSLELNIKGTVDESKLGTYTINYIGRWGIWNDKAQRTVVIEDHEPPRIILHSTRGGYTIPGSAYIEEGFAAADNCDGDLTDQVVCTEENGQVIYRVEDSSGNVTQVVRDIVYYDPIAPEIILDGGERITVQAGAFFKDPGYTALDNSEGDITDRVQVRGRVIPYRIGTYQLKYSVKDLYRNSASVARTVEIVAAPQPETVKPDQKVIYLTFDDGPGPDTEELLDVLKKYDVKVTFFVCNTKYVDLLTRMAEDGHSIGIHSVSHDYRSIYASEDAYFADLYEMQTIIYEKTGITTTLVRFPGGSSNTVSRFNEGVMTRLAKYLHDAGFQYFDWNVDSDDAGRSKTTKKVLNNVTEGIGERDYAVVLQHDTKDYSIAAVEKIILWGLENGYEFRGLDPTSPTCHHGINN